MANDDPDFTSSAHVASIGTQLYLGQIIAGQTSLSFTPTNRATAIMGVANAPGGESLSFTLQGGTSGVAVPSIPFSSKQGVAMLPLGAGDTAYTAVLYSPLTQPTYFWELQSQPVVAAGNLPLFNLDNLLFGVPEAGPVTLGAGTHLSGGPTTGTVPMQPGISAMAIFAPGSTSPPVVTDAGGDQLPVYAVSAGLWVAGVVAVAVGTTSLSVSFSTTDAWCYQFQRMPYVPPRGSAPVYPVALPQPAIGTDWSYALPSAARLVHFGGVFVTSAAAADRYPIIVFPISPNGSAYDMLPDGSPLTASQATNFSGRPGALAVPVHNVGATSWQFTYADYGVLPAGTTIKSSTLGLQAGDQWEGLSLILESP